MGRRAWRATVFLATSLVACSGDSPTSEPDPVPTTQAIDCTAASGRCAALAITGDAPATLTNGAPSPARGFADPSIRRDPASGTLWMAYSWPYVDGTVRVETHLARSDDDGASWQLVREMWQSEAALDEDGHAGWLNSEVVSLAPRTTGGGTQWYSARLRYFTRSGAEVPSFTIQVGVAASPLDAASADEATLGGDFTDAHWDVDVNLADLSAELNGCTWNDPGLLYHDDALHLAMQCAIYVGGEEQPERSFVAVFATDATGAPRTWSWRYAGKLAGHDEAVELGGEMLMQTDLAVGVDGQLLALFSPSAPALPLASHFGCRVVEVASLDPPRLARDDANGLRVRASVTASDLLPSGPCACGYDAASGTGVVLTRRVLDDTQLVVSLVASGLRP